VVFWVFVYLGNKGISSISFVHFAILMRQCSNFRSTPPVKLHRWDLLTCPFFIMFSKVYTHWRALHCHLFLTHYLWTRSDLTQLQRLSQRSTEFYRNITISLECEIIEGIPGLRIVALRHGLPDHTHVLVCLIHQSSPSHTTSST